MNDHSEPLGLSGALRLPAALTDHLRPNILKGLFNISSSCGPTPHLLGTTTFATMASSGIFKELKDGVSMALVHTTRTTGQISNEDLSFQRVSNPSIIPQLDQQSSRLLNLAESLTKIATLDTDIAAPQISDPDSVEENWRGIVDVIDNLLERTDACLDEYTGIIKKLSPSQEDSNHNPAIEMGKPRQWPPKAYRPTNITKPQLFFEQTPRNNQETSFKPLLRSKPHAIIPLEESLKITNSEDGFNQYEA